MKKLTASELVGKTLYVTSRYAKNIPFKIVKEYLGGDLSVDTWEGRNSSTKKPMGRIIDTVFSVDMVNGMLEQNILSLTKLK